jgi:hypothetical protein
MWFLGDTAPPPAPGRVERSRDISTGAAGTTGNDASVGVSPRRPDSSRDSGLWSRRRVFWGICLPRPPTGRVERSGAESRHLPESGGEERRRGFVGVCLSRPSQVVSSGTEWSQDISTDRADTTGDATSVGVSPRRPAGGGSLVETTWIRRGTAASAHPLVVSSGTECSRDTSMNRPDTNGTASPARPLVVSSGAERSRDTSTGGADTIGLRVRAWSFSGVISWLSS